MKRRTWPRRLITIIMFLSLLSAAGFGWLALLIAHMEDTVPSPTVNDIETVGALYGYKGTPYYYDCIIVLGAQVKSIGIPSEALYRRMSLALEYFNAKRAVIIVTGGQGADEPMAEGDFMYEWMRDNNVSAEFLAVDNTSRNTRENIANARYLMEEQGLSRALVITSDYHLPRALAVCREQGIDAIGAGSLSSPDMWWKNHMRETLSWIKYRLGF
ncbi:MAG: YdcF family protein [Oscillospiraceae bacterium]|nr:YdcF family protein [Oscillospiraceae bacterium]